MASQTEYNNYVNFGTKPNDWLDHAFNGLDASTSYDLCFNYSILYGDCAPGNTKSFNNDTFTSSFGGVQPSKYLPPTVSPFVRVYDDVDLVNITFTTNASGVWTTEKTYLNQNCTTPSPLGPAFSFNITNVTTGTRYWWNVTVEDAFGDTQTVTYYFDTADNWAPQRNYTLWLASADHYPSGTTINTYNNSFTQYITDYNNATCRLMLRVENRSGWVTISDTYVTNSSTATGMGVEAVNYDVYPRFDIDRDGDIDLDDTTLITANIGSGLAIYDVDRDTDVDGDDVALVASQIGNLSIVKWSFNATDNVSWTNVTYGFAVNITSGSSPGGPGGGGAPITDEEEIVSEYWFENSQIKIGPEGLLFGDDLYIPWWIVGLFFALVITLTILTKKKKLYIV